MCLLTDDVRRLADFYKRLLETENDSSGETHEKGAFTGTWLYAENGGKVVFEDTDILYLVKKPQNT